VPVLELDGARLAETRITLGGGRLEVEGAPVAAVVFCCSSQSDFSAGFDAADQSFCDAEVRAQWLAVLRHPGLFAVNRVDAVAWFEAERWSLWRRSLGAAGLAVVPCELGARGDGSEGKVWLPFLGAAPRPLPGALAERALGCARIPQARWTSSTLACGAVVHGEDSAAARRAAVALARRGVELAELACDEQGRVAWVDTLPALDDSAALRAAADAIAARVEEHVHGAVAHLPAG
jgi:hypothetical protein